MKFLHYFDKKSKGKNFFELKAKEKKRIIDKAIRGSNELQLALVRKFEKQISSY